MPYTRPYTEADLAMDIFSTDEQKIQLAAALEAGKELQLVTSSFKDPGPDYCAVLIEGVEIVRVKGY